MKAIQPSFEIMRGFEPDILEHLEKCIRTCYKSEEKIGKDSAEQIVRKIMNVNHVSTIEHAHVTVRFICNRGFTHELVRHRLASYSQESTRYCNYSRDKFGNELTFIIPPGFVINSPKYVLWSAAMKNAEDSYLALVDAGAKAQEARGVLPIDVKTEIVMTTNLRHWRDVFKLRCSKAAHPSMQQLMIPLREEFKKNIPLIFDDLE